MSDTFDVRDPLGACRGVQDWEPPIRFEGIRRPKIHAPSVRHAARYPSNRSPAAAEVRLNRAVELTVTRDERDTATVLVVSGEVDVHTAQRLRDEVKASEARDVPLVVDLSGVPFMDSTGLGVLVGALARSRETGHRLVLCAVPSRTRRLLSLTGLDGEFDLVSDLETAVQA